MPNGTGVEPHPVRSEERKDFSQMRVQDVAAVGGVGSNDIDRPPQADFHGVSQQLPCR